MSEWAATYANILSDVMQHGSRVMAGTSLSVGSSRETMEMANYSFSLDQPLDRVLRLPGRRFNLNAAVGRLVWMLTGNDRVDDVEFYDSKAILFSDDGFSVPGSADGSRLFRPRPGLNQIERLVDLLRADEGTRRAVAVIYHPEDAGRLSKDVPCHIAVSYNLRSGALHATTIMRSCNAGRVLPYDFFLFSLLFEIVGRSIDRPLGGYHQFTVSMHVYLDEMPGEVAQPAEGEDGISPAIPMPTMPHGDPWASIRALAAVEKYVRVRFGYGMGSMSEAIRYAGTLEDALGSYWASFGLVLLMHSARRSGAKPVAVQHLKEVVDGLVFPAFRGLV